MTPQSPPGPSGLTPNLPNIDFAIELLKSIASEAKPRRYFSMEVFQYKDADSDIKQTDSAARECGTVCCLSGWLALQPAVQNQGFYPDQDSGALTFGPQDDSATPAVAMAKFLGCNCKIASAIVLNTTFKGEYIYGTRYLGKITPRNVITVLEALKSGDLK